MSTFAVFEARKGAGFHLESLAAYAYLRWQGRSAAPYDESVFRHLLSLERTRANHAERTVLLVLVSFKPLGILQATPGGTLRIPPLVASRLFSGLAQCIREVDFIGWYREGLVAGAALAQGATPPSNASVRVRGRVRAALCRSLAPRLQEKLQVRVVPLHRRTRRSGSS